MTRVQVHIWTGTWSGLINFLLLYRYHEQNDDNEEAYMAIYGIVALQIFSFEILYCSEGRLLVPNTKVINNI